MDPLSHVALAHNLIRLRRGTHRSSTVISAALVGALAPDVDILLLPLGWDRYMAAHESGTHSAIGALVCAGLVAALTRALWAHGRYREMMAAGVVGTASHLWFDVLSGATIRPWWPLVDTPVGNLGIFPMADPWVALWCVAMALVIARWRDRRATAAVIFLAVLASFATLKTAMRLDAARVFRERVTDVGELLMVPRWGSLTAWDIYGRNATNVSKWGIDSRTGAIQQLITTPRAVNATDQQAIGESLEWDTVRNFRRTHALAFARVAATPDAIRVLWSDLRYCEPDTTPAGEPNCTVRVGGEYGVDASAARLFVTIGGFVQTR